MAITMTLLEAVNQAQGELGLTQSSSVAGSQDPTAVQFYNLVNREGRNMQQSNDWTALQTYTIINSTDPLVTTGDTTEGSAVITNLASTTGLEANYWVCNGENIPIAARVISVDSATQVTLDSLATSTSTGVDFTFAQDTYDFPSDFDRPINDTHWDRTNRWPLIGPDTPQQNQWLNSGIVTTGPRRHFRQVGQPPTAFQIWPPPATTEVNFELSFYYISQNWAKTAAGVTISQMTSDDDVFIIDPNAIILGIKWRWKQAKQLAYAAEQAEYLDYVRGIKARDGGARTLSMSPRFQPYLLTSANVQDGYYPSS